MATTFKDGKVYEAQVTNWGLTESTKKQTPQFFVSAKIVGEVSADGELLDAPDYERTVYRAITEGTIDRLIEDLEKLGFTGDSFDKLDRSHPEAFDLGGRKLRLRCKHEEYEGKVNEKWDFDFGKVGGGVKAADKTTVSKLNALFGKKLKSAKLGSNGHKAPTAADTAKQAEDVF